MKRIIFNELIELIQSYLQGANQAKPLFVWCDNFRDLGVVSNRISKQYKDVLNWDLDGPQKAGGLIGDGYVDSDGKLIPLNEVAGHTCPIPRAIYNQDGSLKKLFIYGSIFKRPIEDKCLTIIEWAARLHSTLNIPIIILYDISSQKEDFKGIDNYEQIVCTKE